jgi:hypothetical protein
MSRYIDYDAIDYRNDKLHDKSSDFIDGVIYMAQRIEDAPSIDIEPKRGEWVKRTHNTLIAQVNFAYCSECGQPIMHEHTRSLWNFCPNCGVDMREREGE